MPNLSFGQLASIFTAAAEHAASNNRALLKDIGDSVADQAQAKFGTYQPAAGFYRPWVSLTESTQQDRVAKGFPANEPLLRTGETRDSIQVRVDLRSLSHGSVHIGSNEDRAVWHEMGTTSHPPRPFLGPALVEKSDEIVERVGKDVAARFRMKVPYADFDRIRRGG